MCSKHFVGGNGTTVDQPDPLPPGATEGDSRILSNIRKGKTSSERTINTAQTVERLYLKMN